MLSFIMENRWLLAQIIGSIGSIIVIIGMQQKQYDRVVLSKICNEFLSSIHYILLEGYTGMIINLASCFSNGVYWYRNKKGKSNLGFQILFGAVFVTLGALSWHGWISIFVVVAKLVSSVALGIRNTRVIRILNMINYPCWLVYNAYMGSIPGLVGDSLTLCSVLIAIIRLDALKQQDKNHSIKAE